MQMNTTYSEGSTMNSAAVVLEQPPQAVNSGPNPEPSLSDAASADAAENSPLCILNSALKTPAFPRSSGESPRAYSAFMTFFQLGHGRSLQATADKLDESIDIIKKWSSKFSWSGRIQSYNAGLLQQQAEAEAASQREQVAEWSARMTELRRQEWAAAQKLLSAVQFYLESCGEEQLEKMTLSQVARALNISSSISRMAITGAGLPEKAEPALSPIQIQLTDALNRAFAKHENAVPDSANAN
jgi:hypothetical protein